MIYSLARSNKAKSDCLISSYSPLMHIPMVPSGAGEADPPFGTREGGFAHIMKILLRRRITSFPVIEDHGVKG
jgi:hypothetical protein